MSEGAGATDVQLTAVSVDGYAIAADIGIHSHEIGKRQSLLIDVTLSIDSVPCDDLAATVDYCQIGIVITEIAQERIGLIETFARRVAERCLDWPLVRSANVNVRKPSALPGAMASTRISVSRRG